MQDIETRQDCRELVERFYDRVRRDPLLGPIFSARLDGRWPEHLAKMERFWTTVLLAEPLYAGRPLEAHLDLAIGAEHFQRWLALWTATLDERFRGPRVEHAKRAGPGIAERMRAFLEGGAAETPARGRAYLRIAR